MSFEIVCKIQKSKFFTHPERGHNYHPSEIMLSFFFAGKEIMLSARRVVVKTHHSRVVSSMTAHNTSTDHKIAYHL